MKQCEKCGHKDMKNIQDSKKFGKILCRRCYQNLTNIEIRKEKVKKHLCLDCGKSVDPIKCPHCKKIISYQKRCKKCLDKSRNSRY